MFYNGFIDIDFFLYYFAKLRAYSNDFNFVVITDELLLLDGFMFCCCGNMFNVLDYFGTIYTGGFMFIYGDWDLLILLL